MSFRFGRREELGSGTQRIAGELLDEAIERLDRVLAGEVSDGDELEKHVHEIRKRTKELRGLLRLVQPALGAEATLARRQAAAAARELAAMRDAQALVGTLDELADAVAASERDSLRQARDGQHRLVRDEGATAELPTALALHGMRAARAMLTDISDGVDRWSVPDRFRSIEGGVRRTYRRGRRAMRAAAASPTDESLHEWRTAVKTLWYQVRLLEHSAPSILEPLAGALGDLGDALGDDHNLAILAGSLVESADRYGGTAAADAAVELARREQAELRRRAFRLGARLYAEPSRAFSDRLRAYWRADRRVGRELPTGGLEILAQGAASASPAPQAAAPSAASTTERERKFLVADGPDLSTAECDAMRQGYVALDGDVAVRVRRGRDGAVLTVKGGHGASRTEVEWPITDVQFDALWALTGSRRVEKRRYQVPLDGADGGVVAALDVFGGRLDGVVVVEVEFDDDDTMATFEPPSWFGAELTDDPRWSNAALAVDGAPD
jgi:CYTH domain-containing protein/CHAD domain-containing protein